jgi:hypothetical protein
MVVPRRGRGQGTGFRGQVVGHGGVLFYRGKWDEKSYIAIRFFSFIGEQVSWGIVDSINFIIEAASPDVDCQKTIGVIIGKRIITIMPVVNCVDSMSFGHG